MYLKKNSLVSIDISIKSDNIFEYTNNLKKEFLKKFISFIIKDFNEVGFFAKDCTPWDKEFLSFGQCTYYNVKEINKTLSKLHLSIEFKDNSYKGMKCFVDENSFKEEKIGKNIVSSFKNLGFIDLGVKHVDVYKIKKTNMPCILLNIDCDILEFERDKINLISSLSKILVNSIINLGTM